jgi:hypothetical protein
MQFLARIERDQERPKRSLSLSNGTILNRLFTRGGMTALLPRAVPATDTNTPRFSILSKMQGHGADSGYDKTKDRTHVPRVRREVHTEKASRKILLSKMPMGALEQTTPKNTRTRGARQPHAGMIFRPVKIERA